MEELWNGFPADRMEFEGYAAIVVSPAPGTSNGKLMVKTHYLDAFSDAVEIPLLNLGFHMCFIQNDFGWGTDEDVDRKARFVRFVCQKYHLSEKTIPVGMSCGGLMAIKFAAKYPELVSCMYLDAPVLNYMSCPCGFGDGDPLTPSIPGILSALKMDSISQLLGYREMPLDKLPILIENRIPVVMVSGDKDMTVPFHENGLLLQQAYEKAGLELAVYIKPGCDHHPHGLDDPQPVVDFILSHT